MSDEKKQSLTAALFAGGNSERMGADKALLEYQGKKMWQHQLDTLQNLKADAVVVSARKQPEWMPQEVDFVADSINKESEAGGPLAGLRSVMRSCSTTHILALAIDLPKMTTEFLCELIHKAKTESGVVVELNGFYQPLATIYPREIYGAVCSGLMGEDKSFQKLLKKLTIAGLMEVIKITPEDAKATLFENWNSPEDVHP
ncbi:MAG: molybdenum cofactor guanylyltransferase [Verrucomicrobiota bacterium]